MTETTIFSNVVLWQSIVWAVFGYLIATACNALVGVPRRLLESM